MKIKVFTILFLGFFLFLNKALGQCAMCKATLEVNVSNGSQEYMASTLNFGILYLFCAPYLIIAIVGYVWYKQSKSNAKKGVKSI